MSTQRQPHRRAETRLVGLFDRQIHEALVRAGEHKRPEPERSSSTGYVYTQATSTLRVAFARSLKGRVAK